MPAPTTRPLVTSPPHDGTFHVTEMPALTNRLSVTSDCHLCFTTIWSILLEWLKKGNLNALNIKYNWNALEHMYVYNYQLTVIVFEISTCMLFRTFQFSQVPHLSSF